MGSQTQLITRISQSSACVDIRLFPYITNVQARQDAYKQLSNELYKFARIFARSASHNRIVQTLEKLWVDARKGCIYLYVSYMIDFKPEHEVKVMDLKRKQPDSQSADLYQHIDTKIGDNDYWEQLEVAKKETEEMEWKKADATQVRVDNSSLMMCSVLLKKWKPLGCRSMRRLLRGLNF